MELRGRSRYARYVGALGCFVFPFLCISAPSAVARPFEFWGAPQEEFVQPEYRPRKKLHRKTKRHDSSSARQGTPAGPLHIIVSVARQKVTVFSKGVRIAEAPVSTGVPGHPTPMGIFSVISKARYHESNIYSGAPMPYMQRITWSGIAMHQGPLPGRPASHGCIRLPAAFAVKLWGLSKVGARVIVTRDDAVPTPIDHARLFQPKSREGVPPDGVIAATPDLVTPAALVEKAASRPAEDSTPAAAVTAQVTAQAGEPTPVAGLTSPPAAKPNAGPPKRKEPVHVFVSRKESRFYVRQGFTPVFDAPLTIAEPDQPWGTHVYTVMDIKEDKAEWNAVSVPSGYVRRPDSGSHRGGLSKKEIASQEKRAAELPNAPSAAQALDRFELPKTALDRIAELVAPGSSLIVSDNALSDETGLETGFIVLTR